MQSRLKSYCLDNNSDNSFFGSVTMQRAFFNEDRYIKIIKFICEYKNINQEEMLKILKDKECSYFLLLLLEKFKCADTQRLLQDFTTVSKKVIEKNMKKAEEKFYINREFRERYFLMEELIKKII